MREKTACCKRGFFRLFILLRFGLLLILGGMLSACTSLLPSSITTPLPAEYLPTAAALTLAARPDHSFTPSPTAVDTRVPVIVSPKLPTSETQSPALPEESSPPTAETLEVSPEPSEPTHLVVASLTATENTAGTDVATAIERMVAATDDLQTATAALTSTPGRGDSEPNATPTPAPPIPEARIQIFRMGDLSKVISPLEVSSRLTCGDGKVVRVELFGEDGRLLGRHVRTYSNIPWETARLGINMEFEISAAAELARLVISAEDSFGRLIEVNSVKLVLLSQGMNEFNPPTGLQQKIIIHDPIEQALIQNGRVIVSGRAQPESNQPLRVMLVGEDGRILGQRLAGVSISIPGDYGTFIAEVPFSVSDPTPALLVVFEEGGTMSPMTYLTSIHLTLAP